MLPLSALLISWVVQLSVASTTLSSPMTTSTRTNYVVSMNFQNLNLAAVDITGMTAKSTSASTSVLFEVWYYPSPVTSQILMSAGNGWTRVYTGNVVVDGDKVATISISSGTFLIPAQSTYSIAVYSGEWMPTPIVADEHDLSGGNCILKLGSDVFYILQLN